MPDQPLVLRAPTVSTTSEDVAPGATTLTALSRIIACVRQGGPLSLSATVLTPATLQSASAGALSGSTAPLSWTSTPDGNGPATIRVTVADGTATSGVDVSFTVTEVNDPPSAVNDALTLDEDALTPIAVTTNDSPGPTNEAAQVLRVRQVPPASTQGGALSFDGGVVTYVPPADYNGVDSFTYTVEDNGTTNGVAASASAVATVNLTITPINDAPRLSLVSRVTAEDLPLELPAVMAFSGTPGPADEASQALAVQSADSTSDAGGRVSFDGGTVVYAPPPDFSGVDRFSVTVVDDGALPASARGVVEVAVSPVNDSPAAGDDAVTGVEDGVVFFAAATLLSNDSAGPFELAQRLVVTSVDPTSDAGGTLALVDGGVTFTPPPDFFGDDLAHYQLVDDGTPPLAATGQLALTVTEVNDAPLAVDDQVTASLRAPLAVSAASLLANDRPGPANEAAQTLVITSVSPLSQRGGTVTLSGPTVSYAAPAGLTGDDSFTYVVTDDGTTAGAPSPMTAMATVHVTVTDTNEAPVATDDVVEAREDTALELTTTAVLQNDAAGPAWEGAQALTVIAVGATTEQGGTATLDGTVIRYAPPTDFNGVDG